MGSREFVVALGITTKDHQSISPVRLADNVPNAMLQWHMYFQQDSDVNKYKKVTSQTISKHYTHWWHRSWEFYTINLQWKKKSI